MNKYQDAFERLVSHTEQLQKFQLIDDNDRGFNKGFYERDKETIKELVDKATPKKPHHFVHERYTRYYCPKCSKRLKKSWSACPICTTMIDWSDE